MKARGDQVRHDTPFDRIGTQRLLMGIAIVSALGIWMFTDHGPASVPSKSGQLTPLLQVDLNAADVRELSLLPAVGATLARRIVENRERVGPFRSLDDLARVHGIGDKSIAGLRDYCFVKAAPTSVPGSTATSADVEESPAEGGSFVRSQ